MVRFRAWHLCQGALLSATVLLLVPSVARGEDGNGTLLLFEGSAGAAASAYTASPVGWAAGLAFGPTFKPRRARVRFHILGNFLVRRSDADERLGGIRRTDLDLFLSQRTVLPIEFPLRAYFETGVGLRQSLRAVPDRPHYASLEPLVVLALGLQLRWTRAWSVGLRGAFEPLEPLETPVDEGLVDWGRATLSLTVGTHF